MNYPEKISYLTLAFLLLLDHQGKYALSDALMLAPLTARVRHLAKQVVVDREQSSCTTGEGSMAEVDSFNEANQLEAAGESSWPCPSADSRDASHEEWPSGLVAEIKLQKVELRCPGCGSHKCLALDKNQLEHLQIRGNLEMHCGYCEAPSLWEFVREAVEEPEEVLV